MATGFEIQVGQKQRLYMLMKLKALNKGIKINGLDDMIIETKVSMSQEDVAWVEKIVNKQ